MKPMYRIPIPVLLSLLIATGACAEGIASSGPTPLPRYQAVVAEVENRNWSDVRVYLLRGATRVRLGTVPSMTSRTLRVPAAAVGGGGGVSIELVPILAQRPHTTYAFDVVPGDRIMLTVEGTVSRSRVWLER